MAPSLAGQIALVTGGTRGIGYAIAEEFAHAGAQVIITGRSTETSAQAAREITAKTGNSLEAAPTDVAQPAACQKLIDEIIQRHGRLDILVNNAGITRDKLIARMSNEDWDAIMETNLASVFYLCRAASRPMLKARSGRIINISSVVGIIGNAGQCNYAAAKAGMIGFSKSLARELGSRGVTVNCIAPGFIETAMTKTLSDETKSKLQAQIPLGRLGQPAEVAAAALFLASPAAAYITGSVLQVDGGMCM